MKRLKSLFREAVALLVVLTIQALWLVLCLIIWVISWFIRDK